MSLLLLFQNHSSVASTDFISLFISGGGPSGFIPLYIDGKSSSNDNITLYEQGKDVVTNTATLYTRGITLSSANMNLFIQAEPPSESDNSITLTMFGSSNPGLFAGINLFINGEALHSAMNLFVSGISSGRSVNNMNLFIEGRWIGADNTIPLFIKNNVVDVSNNVKLFIKGLGTGDDGYPISDSMNLFIRRNAAECIPLFISVITPVSSFMDMFIKGNVVQTNSIDLAIPKTIGEDDSFIILYTRGF